MQCNLQGRLLLVGNARLMSTHNVALPEATHQQVQQLQQQGKTVVLVAEGHEVEHAAVQWRMLGVLALRDQVKHNARPTIAALKAAGLRVMMVTGDNRQAALRVAESVGIGTEDVMAECTPQGKVQVVRQLQQESWLEQHRGSFFKRCFGCNTTYTPAVCMVGDGINDAPALAAANSSIAIGGGTDIAMQSAELVLMSNGLEGVLNTIQLAKATTLRIKMNFVWASAYNLIGVPVAAGVLYPSLMLRLPPMLAGAAMAMSSVSVVTSSLMLRRWRAARI